MGIVLHELGAARSTILERHAIGASFARWPREMRFITPSFTSNSFGQRDLNAIALNTAPACAVQREHPTGSEYAEYLKVLAGHFALPIQTDVDVLALEALPDGEGFIIRTSAGAVRSAFVIWATGEFQYPHSYPFPGAELCHHNAKIASWRALAGDEATVIGGLESGIDAAYHLVLAGKRVRALDSAGRWENETSDLSVSLSPYTRERLDGALDAGRLELIGGALITEVTRHAAGYLIRDADGEAWETAQPPILATGFSGSLQLVRDFFAWEAGHVILTERDESTHARGLFVVGPSVRHHNAIFCYIYKFRQRFAVVAETIGTRLGLDLCPLDAYRAHAMFLDDLSCCDAECACWGHSAVRNGSPSCGRERRSGDRHRPFGRARAAILTAWTAGLSQGFQCRDCPLVR